MGHTLWYSYLWSRMARLRRSWCPERSRTGNSSSEQRNQGSPLQSKVNDLAIKSIYSCGIKKKKKLSAIYIMSHVDTLSWSAVNVGRRDPTVSRIDLGYSPLVMGSKNHPYQKSKNNFYIGVIQHNIGYLVNYALTVATLSSLNISLAARVIRVKVCGVKNNPCIQQKEGC